MFSLVPHKQHLEFQILVGEQQNYDSFSISTAALGCSTPTDEFQGGAGLELLLLNLTLAEAKAQSSLLTHGISPQGSLIFWAKGERLEVVAFIFGVHKYVFNTRRSRWNTVVLQRVLQKCFEYYRNSMDYKQDVIFT